MAIPKVGFRQFPQPTTFPSSLPRELVSLVLGKLNVKDVLRCSLVSKQLCVVTRENRVLWRWLFDRDFGFALFSLGNDIADPRELYQKRYLSRFYRNVREGVYATGFFGQSSESGKKVCALIATEKGQLVSTHVDGTIKIWDVRVGTCLAALSGGKGAETVTCAPNGMLVSVYGGAIRYWDGKSRGWTQARWFTHKEFRESFTTFVIVKWEGREKFFFASNDFSIKCIDDENSTAPLLEPLTGHWGKISHLVYAEEVGKLISASDDGTIRVWDVQTGKIYQVLKAGGIDSRGFESLAITGGMIISSLIPSSSDSPERCLKAWNLRTCRFAFSFTITSFKEVEKLVYKQERIFLTFKSWFVFVHVLNKGRFYKENAIRPCYQIRPFLGGMCDGICGPVFLGKKLYRSAVRDVNGNMEYGIEATDFTAGNDEILKEIGDLFSTKKRELNMEAKRRLKRIPAVLQEGIRVELNRQLHPPCPPQEEVTAEQMAMAIENYRKKFYADFLF
jgi:F-box-like/WD domain, G-beta repeat